MLTTKVIIIIIELIILLLELGGLFSKLIGLLEELQECPLSVIALGQLPLELLAHLFMHFVMIIQLVEIIHQLLVIFHCKVSFHFLHVFDFFFVARELLFHLAHHFVGRLVSLLHVGISALEFLGLGVKSFEKGGLFIFYCVFGSDFI